MDRSTEQQDGRQENILNFRRPMGAPAFALMDEEAAAIVFAGKLFDGDNLFTVAKSIVREDQKRILAEDRAREASIVAERELLAPTNENGNGGNGGGKSGKRTHGRLLSAFVEPTTTLGEVAAVSAVLSQSGIANVPDWQLDERGVPYSIAIYAKEPAE